MVSYMNYIRTFEVGKCQFFKKVILSESNGLCVKLNYEKYIQMDNFKIYLEL